MKRELQSNATPCFYLWWSQGESNPRYRRERSILVSMISAIYNVFRDLGWWIVMNCNESLRVNAPYRHPFSAFYMVYIFSWHTIYSMPSIRASNKPDDKFSWVIRGCDADISTKSIEWSVFFSGTPGIGSNIFLYFNPNKWFTRKGTDVSGPAKLT